MKIFLSKEMKKIDLRGKFVKFKQTLNILIEELFLEYLFNTRITLGIFWTVCYLVTTMAIAY